MLNRRTKEGYKLRVYMDQIKEVRAMTEAQWIEQWITGGQDMAYISRIKWIGYLEQCALKEANSMLDQGLAA